LTKERSLVIMRDIIKGSDHKLFPNMHPVSKTGSRQKEIPE